MVKSKKYTSVLVTARELFWKFGVKRVSVEEICEKASTSKMTFYKYFPNKLELAKVIFNNLMDESIVQFREIMSGESTPAEKVKQVLLMKLEATRNISEEFMQDFYLGREPDLRHFVEEKTREASNALIDDYKTAQENGIFRKDFNPVMLIKIQYKMLELLEDEDINNLFNTKQEMIMEFANLLVYGIVPH